MRAEERVLILSHDTPAFVWAFFATLHHGAVVAMGNPEAPPADLAYLVQYTRATAVITIPRVARSMRPRAPGRRAQDARARRPRSRPAATCSGALEVPPELASLAAISMVAALARGRGSRRPPPRPGATTSPSGCSPSGSTGRSKAAVHTHRDFAFNTEVYAKGTVGYRREDVTV